MFRGSVKSTGYPLHSPISPSLPLPCVTVCHHISTGLYLKTGHRPSIQALNYPAHHSQSASHHISSNNTPTIKTTSPVTINKSRGEKKKNYRSVNFHVTHTIRARKVKMPYLAQTQNTSQVEQATFLLLPQKNPGFNCRFGRERFKSSAVFLSS